MKNVIKGFDIAHISDLSTNVVNYLNQGALRGKYVGFPAIHPHYTMSLPGVTDWTGFPRSGKTQVLMEFLLNTSEFYGWKHLVYFPDVGDATEIVADLIHKRTGKTFDKRYPNIISEQEVYRELPWVLEHFKILTKNDLKAKLSPYEFWDLAVKLKTDMKIHTASIDSWKDLTHDLTGYSREDKYLEDVLSYRNAVAERYKLHLHTVIHPIRTDKDAGGNRKPPTPYDLKGGTEWFNNGKNMITVHRPNQDDGVVELYFNKIKPRSIGSEGVCNLYFDVSSFRYYQLDGNDKIFASSEIRDTKKDKISRIEINPDDVPF